MPFSNLKLRSWFGLLAFCLWTPFTHGQVMLASVQPSPSSTNSAASKSLDAALAQSSSHDNHPPVEVLAEIKINGRQVGEFERVALLSGQFFATAEQFAKWHLRLPEAPPVRIGEADYYPLRVNGMSARLNPGDQALWITAPPLAFVGGDVDFSGRQSAQLTPSEMGIFVNHDFQITGAHGKYQVAGLVELGAFSKAGFLTTRFADRDVFGSAIPIRLETQFVHDFPGRMSSLTIGDSVSAFAPWARQAYYGGVRYASKFSTQPGFLPFVLPSLSGLASEPSTVDVYVNNVRAAHSNIDPGPFAIHNVPVISGQGNVQMVVTDILGRQQVISQPYIYSQQLLRMGINEYTVEGGSLRHDIGTKSLGYGQAFLAGTLRRGISNSLTLDFRGEALARNQTIGIGADLPLLPVGLVSGGVAISHSGLGGGGLVYGQVGHQARSLGISAMAQVASSSFQQLGMLAGERAPRIIAQAQVTRTIGNRTSFSLGFLDQQRRHDTLRQDNMRFRAVTSSLGIRLPGGAYLSLYVSYSPDLSRKMTGALTVTIPLSPRRMMVTTTNFEGGRLASTIDMSQQLPVGNGYGYRARFNTTGPQHAGAEFDLQNNFGRYTLESEQNKGGVDLRFEETGSFVLMHKHIVLSRWLNDSFAIVEVPGSPKVRVYANNQFSATTSRRGIALIPNLVPYDRNTLYLDDSGVPVQMQMDFSEKTVAPMPRTGVMVRFEASKITGALFILTTSNGEPVPLGAEVKVGSDPQLYLVAFRGEVFVSSLSFPVHLLVSWGRSRCEATIPAPLKATPLPRIGPITCREVTL
jgi:outer membrane usher protein